MQSRNHGFSHFDMIITTSIQHFIKKMKEKLNDIFNNIVFKNN